MQSRGKARVEKEIRELERELLQKLRKSLRHQQRLHEQSARQLQEIRHHVRRLEKNKKD